MERAEIDHYVDLLSAYKSEIEQIGRRLRIDLPHFTTSARRGLTADQLPLGQRLALAAEHIRDMLEAATGDIDDAIQTLTEAEADDEKAPEIWPTFRSRGPLPERFAGLRGAA